MAGATVFITVGSYRLGTCVSTLQGRVCAASNDLHAVEYQQVLIRVSMGGILDAATPLK